MSCRSAIAGPNDEWLIIAEEDVDGELFIEQEFQIASDTWVNVEDMR